MSLAFGAGRAEFGLHGSGTLETAGIVLGLSSQTLMSRRRLTQSHDMDHFLSNPLLLFPQDPRPS